MVPASSSHLKKIRTFAQDIDDVRATRLKAAPAASRQSVSPTVTEPRAGATIPPRPTDGISIPPKKVVVPTAKNEVVVASSTLTKTIPIPPRPKTAATPIAQKTATAPVSPRTPLRADAPTVTVPTKRKAVPVVSAAPVKLEASATRDASYPATIITDTKTKRFKLSSAIKEAVTNWWKERVTASKNPTYTVPTATLRKGVIEKATTTTARATTQDHREIVARLKAENVTRQNNIQNVAVAPQVVPSALVVPNNPSWDTAVVVPEPTQSTPTITLPTVVDPEPFQEPEVMMMPEAAAVPTHEIIVPTPPQAATSELEETIETETVATTEVVEPEPAVTVVVPSVPFPQTTIVRPSSIPSEVPTPRVSVLPITKTILPVIPEVPEPEPTPVIEETPIEIPEVVFEPESVSYIEPEVPTMSFEEQNTSPVIVKEVSLFAPEAYEEATIEEEPPSIVPRTIVTTIRPTIPEAAPESFTAPVPLAPAVLPSAAPRPVEENLPTLPASMQSVRRQIENRKVQLQSGAIPASTPSYPSSWQRFLPVGMTVAIVILVGGVISYFVFVTPHTVETPKPDPVATPGNNLPTGVPTTLLANNSSLVIGNESKSALYQSLSNLSTDNDSLQLVSVSVDKTGKPLYRDDLLNLISQNINADFRNNITQLSLGSYRGNPVIVIKIVDVPIAKGALFTWEKTMSRDLSPWFGPAIVRKSSTTLSNFIDTTSGNRDVRVLKSATNTEQITYGFANPGTIIITNTTASFLNIATTYTQ